MNKLCIKSLAFRAWITELEFDWSLQLFWRHAPPERFSFNTYCFFMDRPVSLDEVIANCLINVYKISNQKVQVGKDQAKAQSEKDSHSKNRDGEKLN